MILTFLQMAFPVTKTALDNLVCNHMNKFLIHEWVKPEGIDQSLAGSIDHGSVQGLDFLGLHSFSFSHSRVKQTILHCFLSTLARNTGSCNLDSFLLVKIFGIEYLLLSQPAYHSSTPSLMQKSGRLTKN